MIDTVDFTLYPMLCPPFCVVEKSSTNPSIIVVVQGSVCAFVLRSHLFAYLCQCLSVCLYVFRCLSVWWKIWILGNIFLFVWKPLIFAYILSLSLCFWVFYDWVFVTRFKFWFSWIFVCLFVNVCLFVLVCQYFVFVCLSFDQLSFQWWIFLFIWLSIF